MGKAYALKQFDLTIELTKPHYALQVDDCIFCWLDKRTTQTEPYQDLSTNEMDNTYQNVANNQGRHTWLYSIIWNRSVSWYPYDCSHIVQYVSMSSILNELALQKELKNYMTDNVFYHTQKQQQQNKKSKHKIFPRAGNWTREISHRRRMRYLYTTESTETIDISVIFSHTCT